jgi:hypothetical protein
MPYRSKDVSKYDVESEKPVAMIVGSERAEKSRNVSSSIHTTQPMAVPQ